jgi:SAM-dependent methyltransferase
MSTETPAGQASDSVARNSEFFARDTYGRHANRLDSHSRIREEVTAELRGTGRLLDVGNGGVFEYDPSVVEEIVACDLFLDESAGGEYPPNVTARRGDALALTEPPGSFDAVIEAFLYHHLTGERADDSVPNTRRALAEAKRMLVPGGRLIVVESCIPSWLFGIERALYRPLRRLAATRLLGGHPATLQLPIGVLESLVSEALEIESSREIPLGRWVTQFGRPFPAALTPVRAHLIVARKPATA